MPIVYLLLHPAARLSWQDFSVHWSTVIGLAALQVLYEWRLRVHARGGASADETAGPSVGRRASFTLGLLVMFVTLNGPLHDLSDYYLFSAHMVQHLILALMVPPLLLYGTPGWMLRPALDLPGVRTIATRVSGGRAAFAIFNLTMAFWHLPPMYNTAMTYHPVHIAQHLTMLISATIMWWPLLSPLPELPRLSFPGQMLYSFLMTIPMSVVAVYITMADHTLYPAYSAAPRIWGFTPLADQQLGGLIMWIPGGLFFVGVASFVFFKWSASGADSEKGAQVRT
ncbi:MAG: cytochrome c oxidase assembly protein [Gemmatimonadetes bacterium]|nr:cytochrome c oxidase assembly protein [Gemmatimonadota bacterium]